jgi:hypothetical protein
MGKNPVDLREWRELLSALEGLGCPEAARGLRVLEEAEKEGDQALLSHEEAGELLRALSEALEALFGEEA